MAGGRKGDKTQEPGSDAGEQQVEEQVEELALTGEDESLPWLESDDAEEARGVDTGRIAAFASVGVLALALLFGGIWFATRAPSEPEMVADGGTIAAPEGPIKERPEDPGGTSFQGQADTSFAVAEGKTFEGRLADDGAPAPSIDREQGGEKVVPASPAGFGVQVGAYRNTEDAEKGWGELVRRYEMLSGFNHRVVEGQADIGKVYRLQAVTGDRSSANALCESIRAAGGACQVKG
jgi:cell division septation protein DedD